MVGKIFLAGGGSKEDSVKIDGSFTSVAKTILYIPNAINTQKFPYPSCLNFVTSCLPNVKIIMIHDLGELEHLDLSKFEGIYLGGGSTPKLLYQLKSINFFKKLETFKEQGGQIYGGSAGAIVLGKNIRSSEKGSIELPKDIIGAGFVNAIIWPHYKPEDDAKILELKDKIYAIPKDGGLIIGETTEVVGDCYLFENGQKIKL